MKFGEKSQQEFSNTLYTGFGIFECVAVNPTKKELAAIKGYEIDETKEGFKDFEYESKDAQGSEFVDIVFYIQAISHEDKPIMPVRFRLIDKDVVSEKDGAKKYQFVNQQGFSSWCDDEKNLLDKFTKIQKKTYENNVLINTENLADSAYRLAIQGESNFYNFLQAWLDKGVAFTGKDCIGTDIFIDKKKIFRNVDKYVDSEIRPLIGGEDVGKFNALAMVGISEKDGKINHFQNVYKEFWPMGKYSGWKFNSISPCITSGNWNIDENTTKTHDYLIKQLAKSAYSLSWLKVFSESEHQNSTNETFKSADTNDVSADDTSY